MSFSLSPFNEKQTSLNYLIVLFCKLSWNYGGDGTAPVEKDGSVQNEGETVVGIHGHL